MQKFDKIAISKRFFSCYSEKSHGALARLFGIQPSAVGEWANKGTVPWNKLKYLSDSQAISWDWLLAGMEPRNSVKEAKTPKTVKPRFSRSGINRRFLSLLSKMSQTEIAIWPGVIPSVVSEWKRNKKQVPWQRLSDAVPAFGVRWDWLIDGLKPKYRDDRAEKE